jgi:hypothetical protein
MQVITYSSHPLLPWYVAGWVTFCAVAAAIMFRDREVLRRGWREYWGNLMLSPVIYLAAGILWNLEARGRVLPSLGFTRPDWPARSADSGFLPVLIGAIPLVLIAAFFLLAFVRWTGGAGF